MSSFRTAAPLVRPDDPLAATAVAQLESLDDAQCSALVRAGILNVDVEGVSVRLRLWPDSTPATRLAQVMRRGTLRPPALHAFAMLRRAEVIDTVVTRALFVAKMANLGHVLCEYDVVPVVPIELKKHRHLGIELGILVGDLHAFGFAARIVKPEDFGVVRDQLRTFAPTRFDAMRWGKRVKFEDRVAHLAACAAAFSGDPFGFVDGAATEGYQAVSFLRESPNEVEDAVRKVLAQGMT